MAHNITERDNLFTVREPAWHGLGVVLPSYPTRAEAQALAHPWEPVTDPIYRRVLHPDLTETYELIEDNLGIVRSDTGDHLGVVGSGYQPVSNSVMWDIAEAVEGQGGDIRFETAGSLKSGRKVWVLIRLNEPLQINGDPRGEVIPYFALQNSHDGSGSFRGQATMTRIVCDNTAQMADMDAEQRGTSFVFRHTKNVAERVEEARQAVAGWRESVQAYRLMSAAMIDARVTPEQVNEFTERFIPMPLPGTSSDRVRANVRQAQRQFTGFLNSPTCEGIENTAQGLVAASVEYLNWGRKAHTSESRFKRAYLDRNEVVTDAVALVREIAHV